jgi:hypothetical protein
MTIGVEALKSIVEDPNEPEEERETAQACLDCVHELYVKFVCDMSKLGFQIVIVERDSE